MAFLTQEGRTLPRKAWQQQHADVRRLFLDRLDPDDLRDLARVWSRLDLRPPQQDQNTVP